MQQLSIIRERDHQHSDQRDTKPDQLLLPEIRSGLGVVNLPGAETYNQNRQSDQKEVEIPEIMFLSK